ncbi:MAG: putative toxin-antitoxin system toxin component, PIN family [Clostridiales bacterium]|nr:putative toxin-antitoxin system toxin component, PIN family [Clostridiales bacterium]
MICYAVIDTNVLISSLLSSHGNAATILVIKKIFSGDVIPLYSENILKEYLEVLRRKKFGFTEETVSSLIRVIEDTGKMVIPSPSGEILPDIKDLPFYEVVLEKKDENAHLITGNKKHFPNKPFIVTPKEFLEILEKKSI